MSRDSRLYVFCRSFNEFDTLSAGPDCYPYVK